jgi:hypothetical protein
MKTFDCHGRKPRQEGVYKFIEQRCRRVIEATPCLDSVIKGVNARQVSDKDTSRFQKGTNLSSTEIPFPDSEKDWPEIHQAFGEFVVTMLLCPQRNTLNG